MPDLFMRTDSGQLIPVSLKDTQTVSPNATYLYGPGGIANTPGLNAGVVNAMILPITGLQAKLRAFPVNEMFPIQPLFTGVTASTGSFNAAPCGPTKVVGMAKLCNVTTVFGRVSLQTPTIQIDRAGQVSNRGYFTDLHLIGDPTNPTTGAATPTFPGVGGQDMAFNEVGKQVFQFRAGWNREFSKLLYGGNPANNLGDGYKEFNGLDLLINKGYQDAETGQLCPAADSLLQSFSSQDFTASSSAATQIVQLIQDMYRALQSIADRAGLAPATWTLVMPRDCFYELTKVWPISYATTATTVIAAGQTGTQLQVSALDSAAMRDKMRTGQYLLINGTEVDVTLDDAATATNVSGNLFSCTIYFVPLTVLGNTLATFTEYFDYTRPGAAMDFAKSFSIPDKYVATDAGRYLWVKMWDSYCVWLECVAQERIRLLTPFLAARLTSVRYTAGLPTRSPYPGDPTYYNGGKTSTPSAPSFYAPNVYAAMHA